MGNYELRVGEGVKRSEGEGRWEKRERRECGNRKREVFDNSLAICLGKGERGEKGDER